MSIYTEEAERKLKANTYVPGSNDAEEERCYSQKRTQKERTMSVETDMLQIRAIVTVLKKRFNSLGAQELIDLACAINVSIHIALADHAFEPKDDKK